MITEIVSVLKSLFEEIKKSNTSEQVLDNIKNNKKYDNSVLAAAYSWVFEKIRKNNVQEHGIRLLTEDEIELIGIENYNHILHFYNIGLITSNEIDKLLNQLELMPEDIVNKEVINILLLAVILYGETEILPGSRLHLYSSDTIN